MSEPTYAVKLGWRSPEWARAEIAKMHGLGINCIQVNVEPAMQFVPPYIDRIDGQAYPSEMQVLDQVIDAASDYGLAVQVRQANDRCPDEYINTFMAFLAHRYAGRPNVWLNPANEINCFSGGAVCLDPVQWAADMKAHIRAIRVAGWTAPIVISGTSYSGDPSQVLAQMDADPVFYNDPNLIFGVHHYKRNADPDFNTARRAECDAEWACILDGRYCGIVDESGVNNLGIVDLDPQLNPPNPSSDPVEWADTALYMQQFFAWFGQKVAAGSMHGFIAFNWGSWSGSRNRDNGLTRIGTDGALTAWGTIYRDHWLMRDYAPRYATLADAMISHSPGEAVRRFLPRDLFDHPGSRRASMLRSGIRVTYATGVEAAAYLAKPAAYIATPGSSNVAPANAMAVANSGSIRLDATTEDGLRVWAAS